MLTPVQDIPSRHAFADLRKAWMQVWILAVCSCLQLVRGATGVTALYKNKEYVWIQDKYFYTLDTLFEFVVLAIMLWPALLARIACAWPKEPRAQKNNAETKA